MMLDPGFDGRAYSIALASKRFLQALDIWDVVEGHAQPILDILVSDGRPGEGPSPLYVHFDHREIEEGPFGAMLEDRFLRAALFGAVEAEDRIAYRTETRVVAQTPDTSGVTVTLSDGQTLRAGLLVGCDGRGSGTAKRAGIGFHGHDYDQTSLVCALDHVLPHNGEAHQMFLPAGPLAILPLPGNRSSIVWTETRQRAEQIMSMDDADYMEVLRPHFGTFRGEIALVGQRYSYPLNLILANSFVADRVALAGDSAHGVHPIAGQGLNLGLRDVAALAEVLAGARRRGEDIGRPSVLAEYARWRRFDTAALAATTDTINHLFSNDNPLLRIARDVGLGLVNRTPPLRRFFMREAAGLTGDVPRLMQGRRL
jgi:2-octaprenyl-6-methoxyphenol hydroxylase